MAVRAARALTSASVMLPHQPRSSTSSCFMPEVMHQLPISAQLCFHVHNVLLTSSKQWSSSQILHKNLQLSLLYLDTWCSAITLQQSIMQQSFAPDRCRRPLIPEHRFKFRLVSLDRSLRAVRLDSPSHPSKFSSLKFVSPAQHWT